LCLIWLGNKLKKITVGSVCSGIEAASVAFKKLNYEVKWFSEVADFPSKILSEKYPGIPNLGDMCKIPGLLDNQEIDTPDFICGGTPCQAFSLAGWKKGLEDDRGNLTLKFVDIIESNDSIREQNGLPKSVVLWENVEGALKDKTNAFGCFISSILGLSEEIKFKKWPLAGAIHGPKRNVAWRVLDAKFFGLPHQRRRLYFLAGDKNFYPENVLFDKFPTDNPDYEDSILRFEKNGHQIEVFRGYTDCLYSAYGTKWNGNAAAYNGSLFVSQNGQLRRLTPLECERLMGFPDHYTYTEKAKPTNRYQALGNSWAVPVVQWISERLEKEVFFPHESELEIVHFPVTPLKILSGECKFYQVPTESNTNQFSCLNDENFNGSVMPQNPTIGNIQKIIDTEADSRFFISPVGCQGILRRAEERNMKINPRLEQVLSLISSNMCPNEIERKSRVQKRGRFSV
jgi:DNA (cytosine-5)-methyltransferase 1